MDYTTHSTICLTGDSQHQKDPVLSFLITTPSVLPADCSNGIGIEEMQEQKRREMKKRKKRECDKRYRQNKKKTEMENKNKLDMAMIENENLKCAIEELQKEIFQLTSQLKLIEIRSGGIQVKLEREIEYLRIENEMFKCPCKERSMIGGTSWELGLETRSMDALFPNSQL